MKTTAFLIYNQETMLLKGKFEQSHTVIKFIQWFGCIFLLSIPAGGIIFLFPQPLSVNSLKWIQLIQVTGLFLLPPLLMAYLWSSKPIEWLQLRTSNNNGKLKIRTIFYAIAIMLLALPAINLNSHWNQQIDLPTSLGPIETWMKNKEATLTQLTQMFLNVDTIGGLIVNLLLMALLPALAEELTFRGILQRLIGKKQEDKGIVPHMAIWVTAIVFSAIHMQFYGFIPRMLMGALFGYMMVWSGTIWIPMLMHFLNNAAAVILYYISNHAGWDMDKVDAIGTNNTLWLGIVSVVLTIVGIYMFRRSTTIRSASSRISSGS
jgi:membrane protease YdiL (CAAX protease family)